MQELAQLEIELKQAHLEAAEQELAGATTEVAHRRTAELEAQLAGRAADRSAGSELEREVMEEHRVELAREMARLHDAGEPAAAERLALKARMLEGETAGMKRKVDVDGIVIKVRALEEEVRALREELNRQAAR